MEVAGFTGLKGEFEELGRGGGLGSEEEGPAVSAGLTGGSGRALRIGGGEGDEG